MWRMPWTPSWVSRVAVTFEIDATFEMCCVSDANPTVSFEMCCVSVASSTGTDAMASSAVIDVMVSSAGSDVMTLPMSTP